MVCSVLIMSGVGPGIPNSWNCWYLPSWSTKQPPWRRSYRNTSNSETSLQINTRLESTNHSWTWYQTTVLNKSSTSPQENNTLDIILTTHSSFTQRCKSKPSIGNSDRDIVLFDTTITATRPKPPRRKILLWKKADIQCIRDDLSDLSSITNLNDPSTEDS